MSTASPSRSQALTALPRPPACARWMRSPTAATSANFGLRMHFLADHSLDENQLTSLALIVEGNGEQQQPEIGRVGPSAMPGPDRENRWARSAAHRLQHRRRLDNGWRSGASLACDKLHEIPLLSGASRSRNCSRSRRKICAIAEAKRALEEWFSPGSNSALLDLVRMPLLATSLSTIVLLRTRMVRRGDDLRFILPKRHVE